MPLSFDFPVGLTTEKFIAKPGYKANTQQVFRLSLEAHDLFSNRVTLHATKSYEKAAGICPVATPA